MDTKAAKARELAAEVERVYGKGASVTVVESRGQVLVTFTKEGK